MQVQAHLGDGAGAVGFAGGQGVMGHGGLVGMDGVEAAFGHEPGDEGFHGGALVVDQAEGLAGQQVAQPGA